MTRWHFFYPLCQFFHNGNVFAKWKAEDFGTGQRNFLLNNLKQNIMSKLTIQHLADRVLVEPLAAETKTASGIYIPDSAKEKPQQGKVVAVGKVTKDEPMTVKIGDTVLYGKFAGTELKLDGNDYLIMRESDIFAIL